MAHDNFAQFALVDEDAGITATTEERLNLALTAPDHPLALSQREAKKITANRIRSAMSELSHGKIEKVSEWLDRVAHDNPAEAIRLFMELAQFSLPKLKAIQIDVSSSDGSVKSMSVSQLEAMLGDESKVVDTQ